MAAANAIPFTVTPATGPRRTILAPSTGRLSPNTRRAYGTDLRAWRAWCASRNIDPDAATRADGLAFLAHERGRGMSAATLSRRVHAIAEAYKAMGREPPCGPETARAVLVDRPEARDPARTVPAYASATERLMAACGDDGAGIRDRLVIALLFATGLGREAVCAVHVEHVEITEEGLRIYVPGFDRAYIVPRESVAARAYADWIAHARIAAGPVLRSVNKAGAIGPSLSPCAVNRIVKRRAEEAGLGTISARSLKIGHRYEAIRRMADA